MTRKKNNLKLTEVRLFQIESNNQIIMKTTTKSKMLVKQILKMQLIRPSFIRILIIQIRWIKLLFKLSILSQWMINLWYKISKKLMKLLRKKTKSKEINLILLRPWEIFHKSKMALLISSTSMIMRILSIKLKPKT